MGRSRAPQVWFQWLPGLTQVTFYYVVGFLFLKLKNIFGTPYWIHYKIASVLCFGLLAERHVGFLPPWDQGPNLHPVHWEAVFTTREVLVTWCCTRISLVLIGGGPGWGMGEVSEDCATKNMGTRVLTFFYTNLSFEGYFLLQYFPLKFLCHFLGVKSTVEPHESWLQWEQRMGYEGKIGDQRLFHFVCFWSTCFFIYSVVQKIRYGNLTFTYSLTRERRIIISTILLAVIHWFSF